MLHLLLLKVCDIQLVPKSGCLHIHLWYLLKTEIGGLALGLPHLESPGAGRDCHVSNKHQRWF